MTSVKKRSSGRDRAEDAVRDDLRGLFDLETVHRRGLASLVWLARDLEYNQLVALKVVPRAPATGTEAEEAFHQAAALVAALEHPHVVPLYSAGATDRSFWCSMEYVEGRSLAEARRSSQPMAPSTCLRLVGQIGAALDAAHRLGVVHAGLTPANVLIDAAGDAHVTDFWIPWVLERLGALPGDGGKARRDTYRAPEQVAEGRPGPEADQYALAAVMRACLSGKPPREEGSGMPPRILRALERALSPAPADRFPSVAEFVGALEAGAPSEHRAEAPRLVGLHDDVEELDDEPSPAAPRRRWVPLGVLALVVVGGAVATAWLLSSGATMNEAANAPLVSPPLLQDSVAREVSPLPSPRLPPPVLPDRRDSVVRPPPRPRVSAPVARAPSRPPVAAGRLFVNATPWGQVYVDGVLIGNTPRAGVAISPGAHQLRVARDGFQSFEIAIRIAPGQELRLTDIVLQELKP
jgi:serine/threonine protein kinase